MTITRKVLSEFAESFFTASRTHLRSLRAMQEFTGRYASYRAHIEDFMSSTGMTAADMLRTGYDPSMLENDEFMVSVILYACTCMIAERNELSFGDYQSLLSSVRDAMGGISANDLMKYLCDEFKIDPKFVPEYVQKGIANMFEEREANKICDKRFETLDGPDGYGTFELYHEYMEKNGQKLINDLNTEGYTNTFPPDIMTTLLILKKHNFPVALYDTEQSLPAPRSIIDVLAKKLFALRQNGGNPPPGGFIDFGGDSGD